MRMWSRVMSISFAVCAPFASAGAQNAVSPLATVYSDLSPRLCASERKAGAPSVQSGSYTCKGVGGVTIEVAGAPGSLRATLRRGAGPAAPPQAGPSRDLGDRVEWLGHRGAKGFEPEVAILRLTNAAAGAGGVVEILRVTENDICPAAFIDAASTPRPNEAVRRIAGEIAASFHCGVDNPQSLGPAATLARDASERHG